MYARLVNLLSTGIVSIFSSLALFGMAAYLYYYVTKPPKALKKAMSILGIEGDVGGLFSRSHLESYIGNRPLLVDSPVFTNPLKPKAPITSLSQWDNNQKTRIQITTDLPHDISLYPESVAGRAIRAITGDSDILIGDPAFDDKVVVQGDAAEWLSRLTPEARTAVSQVLSMGVYLEEGVFTYVRTGKIFSHEIYEQTINAMVHTAETLDRSGTIADGLLLAVQSDNSAVKTQSLCQLLTQFSDSPPAVEFLTRTLPESALQQSGNWEHECISMLEQADSQIAMAAAYWLGIHGSFACISPLHRLMESASAESAMHSIAESAIRAAKSRIDGKAGGALSLSSEDGHGGLAIADTAHNGAISLADGQVIHPSLDLTVAPPDSPSERLRSGTAIPVEAEPAD